MQSKWSAFLVLLAIAAWQLREYISPEARTSKTPQANEDQLNFAPASCGLSNPETSTKRFQRLLQFRTISNASSPSHLDDEHAYTSMLDWMGSAYPHVWSTLQVERVNGFSLLLTWHGSDPSLPPVLFVSHLDVVPVPDAHAWSHDPFSGYHAQDGFIYARGALDVKYSAAALLEATEALLCQQGQERQQQIQGQEQGQLVQDQERRQQGQQGHYVPRRTLLIALGHDEEVGGALGAAITAQLLQARWQRTNTPGPLQPKEQTPDIDKDPVPETVQPSDTVQTAAAGTVRGTPGSGQDPLLEIIIDEGGLILRDGMPPLAHGPLAIVGTAEKGYCLLDVTLHARGGHSSMPPTDGSDILSQAARLSTALARQQAWWASASGRGRVSGSGGGSRGRSSKDGGARLRPPVSHMLHALGEVASNRSAVLAALLSASEAWPLSLLLPRILALSGPESSALVHNTLALVRISAGVADNVLPHTASLRFNARTLPGTSHADMVAVFEGAIKEARVNASVGLVGGEGTASLASKVTSHTGRHWRIVQQSIQEQWRHGGGVAVPVVPFLLTGMTDSRNYAHLSRHGVLRFVPYALNKRAGDLGRVHGVDERVTEADYHRAICTYQRMLQLFGDMGGSQD